MQAVQLVEEEKVEGLNVLQTQLCKEGVEVAGLQCPQVPIAAY